MPLTLINTRPRHIIPKIGRIILENADGRPVWSVDWDNLPFMRTPTLIANDGWYEVKSQDGKGFWHYRYMNPRATHQIPEPTLKDYQAIPIPVCPQCGKPI